MGRKTKIWLFQVKNWLDYTREDLLMTTTGNLKKETVSLLIAVQNNAIRTSNIKTKIDNTQQNSKRRL